MHTPGPWQVSKLYADGTIITKGGHFEITTPEYDVVAYMDSAAPIRKIADARLIAAAPDLLAALQSLLEGGVASVPNAHDAIAKATLPPKQKWYDLHGILDSNDTAS